MHTIRLTTMREDIVLFLNVEMSYEVLHVCTYGTIPLDYGPVSTITRTHHSYFDFLVICTLIILDLPAYMSEVCF